MMTMKPLTLLLPNDFATWLYITGFIIKGYGFGLFLWWAVKASREDAHVSTVFLYITAILLGSCIRDGIEMYGGYCRGTLMFDAKQMQEQIYETWFWPARMLIVNLSFAVLIIHMTVRAFIQRKK